MSFIPPEILQFGIAGLLFIVWAYSSKQHNQAFVKVSHDSNAAIIDLAERTSTSYETAIEDSRRLNKELLDLIRDTAKDDMEMKAHLHRTLTRIEEKLDQPVRCPASIAVRKIEEG